ncbi:MAG: saccharopine dehydrogenase [Atribacteria sp.]|nr:saccharopine dehydrogenase [Candidatus Atribacteria bacterium]MCG2761945.1 saccharopine dehydrogenase NADP-binding domain-containing protein [Candidatus Atribacteria bacterium]MCG2821278.1 saccharopine dehydrogenase NADP-binding domain-containing protein [Candidatus Atribacteria bacterium]
MKAIVLGCGLIGELIAKDLAKDENFQVTAADIDEGRLNKLLKETGIGGIKADLSDSRVIKKIVAEQDIVIGAVPGFLGFNMLRSVIETSKNIVDISFMAEDPLSLDELAKKKGVTAVVDMGVAPGMSHMIVGYVDSLMDETKSATILVGGLPVIREWPYEYKIAWSPKDVIEEYIRPARLIECGKIVEKPALSDLELVDLPQIGTLEAFNTDGLRSLLYTIKIPSMKEKTLRYPGYAEKMRMLRETGFFSDTPIEVRGVKVKPIDLTSKLLFPKWELKEGEEELTVMRVIVQGKKDEKILRYTYDLIDYYDKEEKATSMSRATGFPCAIMARLVAQGEFQYLGVCPPEYIGREHEVYQKVMKELEKRNIFYKESIEEI